MITIIFKDVLNQSFYQDWTIDLHSISINNFFDQ